VKNVKKNIGSRCFLTQDGMEFIGENVSIYVADSRPRNCRPHIAHTTVNINKIKDLALNILIAHLKFIICHFE